MADYSASIELLIKGLDKLKALEQRVSSLQKEAEKLSKPLTKSGTAALADVIEEAATAQKGLNAQTENGLIRQVKLNSAVRLYERRLAEVGRTAASNQKQFAGDLEQIQQAFEVFKSKGSIQGVQAVSTELGRIIEYSREITRLEVGRVKSSEQIKEFQRQINVLKASGLDVSKAENTLEKFSVNAGTNKYKLAERYRILLNSRLKQLGAELALEKQIVKEQGLKQKARGEAISGAVSNALIGASFPLLFGQGPLAAAGGGLGGLAGGLIGGSFGFGLSLLGTALGDALQKTLDLEKGLQQLNSRFSAVGAQTKLTYTDIENLAGALKLTKEEALDAVREFTAYGDAAAALALAFSGIGGAAVFQTLGSAGVDQESALRAIVQLRELIGNEAARELALSLTANGVLGTQEKLLDLILEKQFDINVEADKQVQPWDRVRSAIAQSLALAINLAEVLGQNSLPGLPKLFGGGPDLSGLRAQLESVTPENLVQERLDKIEDYRKQILDSVKDETSTQTLLNNQLDKYSSSANKAARDKERERERVAKILLDQKALTDTLNIQQKYSALIAKAEQDKDEILARRLQGEQKLEELAIETAKKLVEEKDASAKIAIAKTQQAKAALIIQESGQDQLQLELRRREVVAKTLADIQYEIEYEQAVTREKREQLALDKALKKAKEDGLKGDELAAFAQAFQQRQEQQRPIQQYMLELQKSLNDTESKVVSLTQTIETQLGSAMSNAIVGLVTGAERVEEVLSQMFANIGKAFIDMATQIIAQQVVMITLQTILKALGVATSGGGGSAPAPNIQSGEDFNLPGQISTGMVTAAKGAYWPGGFKAFANGGMVTRPTLGLVGEGGEPEYIIPASKMSGAMARYSSGQRGSSVVNGAATAGGGGGSQVIRFESTVINNVEYVTRSQAEAMSRQAAKQGAAGGYAKTMGGLRNSRATRARVGMG